MKRCLLIMQLVLAVACCGMAQTTTLVYGNLGVENVTISVYRMSRGTITDAKGHYELPLSDQPGPIRLHYSCIGYQDTLIVLSPRQLQSDSIHISFKMREREYKLEEVSVLANRPLFDGDRSIIMDFEIYDGTLCLLQGSGNQYRLLLADTDLTVFDTLPIRHGIRPSELLKDCMGHCQLLAADSVYEIDLKDKSAPYLGIERNRYYAIMDGCLFLTDRHLYIKTTAMDGLVASFYRIDLETKQMEPLFVGDGSDKLVDIADEMKYAAKHPPENGRGPTLSLWNKFVRNAWFCDSAAHLALAGDTLVYFDHDGAMVRRYDLNLNEIGACAIDYPNRNEWKPQILQDPATNQFYTFIGHWLNEIDLHSGETTPKARINVDLYNKVALWDRHLYVLRRQHTSSGKLRSYVERVDF